MRKQAKKQKNFRFLDLFTTCTFGLSILLLAACFIIAVAGRDDPNGACLLGIKPVYVSTNAMEPSIRQNSIVFFRKAKLCEVKEGDVILRTDDDCTVIRRVIGKTSEGGLITKADNRFFEDSTPLEGNLFIAILLSR